VLLPPAAYCTGSGPNVSLSRVVRGPESSMNGSITAAGPRSGREFDARRALGGLALVEMLPELDAMAFRVVKADELALPLGVCSDGHGRRVHAILV
jgi:hypothetical protein